MIRNLKNHELQKQQGLAKNEKKGKFLELKASKHDLYFLRTAYESTAYVKDSKVYILTAQYEIFTRKEGKTFQEMHTRFTSIKNKLQNMGKVISLCEKTSKILGVLTKSW